MSKLFQQKEWLTLEETAKELSKRLNEPVGVADVLQLGLNEKLTLSVNLLFPTNVKIWKGELDSQALEPEPTMTIGVYDFLLDVADGAKELEYQLKVLRNGKADKLDKSVVYVLGDNGFVYELPVNYDLEIVVRTSAITEFESSVIENERQKAVAQTKASRTSASLSVNDLLESTVTNLIEEIRPEDDSSRYCELYIWKELLEKEERRITSAPYSDEGRREDRLDLVRNKIKEVDWHLADCPPKSIPVKHTETIHLEWPSIFHNIQLPDDKDLLEAVKVWEKVSDAKFIDIKGYGCVMLHGSVDQRKCAELEVIEIEKLLNTGSCELLTGYSDFDLEQIPVAYKAMLTGRWNDFISIKSTKAYLASEQDEFMADSFFPKHWVVATQVQALIWYKNFLLDVVKNGISFRDEELQAKLLEQEVIDSEPEAIMKNHFSFDDDYSTSIKEVIKRAHNSLLNETKKPGPLKVFKEIHHEFLYRNINKKEERKFDRYSIIQECEDSLVKTKRILEWKKGDGETKPMSASAFSAVVKELNDKNSI